MEVYSGDHKQIGKQIGEFYRKEGTSTWASIINKKLFSSQKRIYRKYFPKKLIQLTEIAKSADFDVDNYIYNNICACIEWHQKMSEPQKGCTIFGVQNNAGTFVGRNYDWRPGTENVFRAFKCLNTDSFGYIGISDMDYLKKSDIDHHQLFYEIEDAINDQGLYIGLTFAYHDGARSGISPIHMNQLVAETCSTVNEAIKLFKKVPLAVPKNFLIADVYGNVAVIEHAATKFKVLRPINGIIIQTNHYVDNELAQEDTCLLHNRNTDTFKRYSEALNKLTHHKETVHQIGTERLVKDPDLDILENRRNIKTIWSLAMDMTGRKYRLYWNLDNDICEEKLEI